MTTAAPPDRAMVVTCFGCVPINRIVLIDAQAGRTMTRPWVFAINGRIDVSSYLDNGSVIDPANTPGTVAGDLDVRNVAMGYDGVLTLGTDGTELAHIFRFHIYLDPITDQLQPLRSPRRLTRMTGFDATIEFEEYVINDNLLLATILPQVLGLGGGPGHDPTNPMEASGCEPWMTFMGTIEHRLCF
jgi:hypothetical protein